VYLPISIENFATEGDESTPFPDADELLNHTADTIIVVNERRIELSLPTKHVLDSIIEMELNQSI
jgi:hypothetical protein